MIVLIMLALLQTRMNITFNFDVLDLKKVFIY